MHERPRDAATDVGELITDLDAGTAKPAAGIPLDRHVGRRRAKTATIAKAMRILAGDIQSDDGVATAACLEAAERLEELAEHEREDVKRMRTALRVICTWAQFDGALKPRDVHKLCTGALGVRGR